MAKESKESKELIVPKVSLPRIVEGINKTLEAFEDGLYDEKTLDEILGDLRTDLGNSVDRYIYLLDYLGNQSQGEKPGTGIIGLKQELYREYRKKMEIAEALKERVKARALRIIEESSDLEIKGKKLVFEGNLGKLAAQASPGRLIVDFNLGSKSFGNLIDQNTDVFNIPAEYIKTVTVLQLDTDRLKEDLKLGKEIPFARLEKNNHLRIRR